MAKKVKGSDKSQNNSVNKESPVWCFNNADNDGEFRFAKETVNPELMLDKILSLSKMTWFEIEKATHDDRKSKNHTLNYDTISTRNNINNMI